MKNTFYLYIKCFSDFGSNMDMLVLNVMILNLTHSPVWLSVNLALRTLGGAISSLFAGNLADKMDRRKIMIVSDAVRLLVIAFIIAFHNTWSILGGSFAIGVMNSYFSVSFGAITPDMFGEENLVSVNALIGKLQSVSQVAGWLGAALLGTLTGVTAVLCIDGVSYLLSAIALSQVKHNHRPALDSNNQPSLGIIRDVREICRYALENRVFLLVSVVFLADMTAASVLNLAAPLMAARIDPNHETLVYGVVWGAIGVGTVLSIKRAVLQKWVTKDMPMGYWLGSIGSGICFVSFLVSRSLVVSIICALAAGVFESCGYISIPTLFQQVPHEIRGRIFGFQTMLRSIGFACGFVAAPVLIRNIGYTPALVMFQGAYFVVVIVAIVLYQLTKAQAQPAAN